MTIYRLNPEAYKCFRKRFIRTLLIFLLLLWAMGILLLFQNKSISNAKTLEILSLSSIGSLVLCFLYLRQQKSRYQNYSLKFTNDAIIVERKSKKQISVKFEDITRIDKLENGSLVIKSKLSPGISVPADLENFSGFEKMLNDIKMINVIHEPYSGKSHFFISAVLLFALFSILKTLENADLPIVILSCGFAFYHLKNIILFFKSKSRNYARKQVLAWDILMVLILIVILIAKQKGYISPNTQYDSIKNLRSLKQM